MRIICLSVALFVLCAAAVAGEIREFDIKTLERLGNELTEVSQRADRGATDAVRKRAVRTAKAALQGKLFNIRYDYVVLDDPDGNGFLVYALGQSPKRGDVVIHGHFRVTVSVDGEKAERADALSHSLLTEYDLPAGLPKGTHLVGAAIMQIVSAKPVETLIYASNLMKMPLYVATPPNGQAWIIENGKMTKSGSKK
jgi:hypothetical protein